MRDRSPQKGSRRAENPCRGGAEQALAIFSAATSEGVSPTDYRDFVASLHIDEASRHALLTP